MFDAAAAEASEVEAYARAWATGGDGARGGAGAEAEWLRGFGPIDVGCRIEIDRVGLDGSGAPPSATVWLRSDATARGSSNGFAAAASATRDAWLPSATIASRPSPRRTRTAE